MLSFTHHLPNMRFTVAAVLVAGFALSNAIQPLRPPIKRSFPKPNATQVGEPLFLTPYINGGDIETGRSMAQVDWSMLQGNRIYIDDYILL